MNAKRDDAIDGTPRQVGILVSRKQGESALNLLNDLKLLDTKRQIRSDDDRIVIPLTQHPLDDQQETLQRELQPYSLVDTVFDARESRSRTLAEELQGKIPATLLSQIPASLDIVGDIAVVDLPSQLSSYEKEVSRAILAVNKNVRSVFSKAGSIVGSERVRPLRYLVGENRTVSIHRETGCKFMVDLSKAYFSPRLSYEHQRIAEKVHRGESIIDMFAGVGPFSILISKLHPDVKVNAIDANMEAIRLLKQNIKLNKLRGPIRIWHGDAKRIVRQNLVGEASRVIMNHPSEAVRFIGSACQALKEEGGTIHYYTFSEGVDCEAKAVREFETALLSCERGLERPCGTRKVRGVAPMRWQVVVDAKVGPAE